jgi:transcriptional regulator with XRE-family HTH domain
MFRTEGKEFQILVAENSFISDIQIVIERVMDEKGVSQADLAKFLNVSEARVSQILSGNGKNLQARTIARIAHVLNLKPVVEFTEHCGEYRKFDFQRWARLTPSPDARNWNVIANENDVEWAKAA